MKRKRRGRLLAWEEKGGGGKEALSQLRGKKGEIRPFRPEGEEPLFDLGEEGNSAFHGKKERFWDEREKARAASLFSVG